MIRRILATIALTTVALVQPAAAAVEDDFEVTVIERALGGSDQPGMVFTAINDMSGVKLTVVRNDGHRMKFNRDLLKAGETWRVTWRQNPGRASYQVGLMADGLSTPLEMEFTATVANDFDISVVADDIDLESGLIGYSTSGNVDRVQIELFATDGSLLIQREMRLVMIPGQKRGLDYTPPDEEIGLVRISAFDDLGFKKELTFTPYLVPIPHDEVNFEFGSAEIKPSEEAKLYRVIEESEKAVAKLGQQIRFRLYVAGYTDTVGSNESNMDLSRRRASSIAKWLREHGLRLQVCSRGFGESVLAVETPDNTENGANRRTLFVISGQAPFGKDFPAGAGWSCSGK
ncbi:MAG TPA: OmpA family protein [Myxococcota bacterium]|nr:OmpA family protein [Myxococcota bacterium]HPB51151.1 OmpA family protein [Myxococcota bacterium]